MVKKVTLGKELAAFKLNPELQKQFSKALSSNIFRIDPKALAPPPDPNLASEFYNRLKRLFSEFQESLDEDHEVGATVANFSTALTIHVEGIGYWNPSLIILHGVSQTGDPMHLVQHVSQISIALVRLPKLDPQKPARRIGFDATDSD